MIKADLFSKEWCELIFEGRNRDYGAYLLRKGYARRLLVSLLVVCGVVALSFFVPLLVFRVQRHIAEREALESVANLSQLEEIKNFQNDELKAVATALRPKRQELKDAMRFAPVIEEQGEDNVNQGNEDETLLLDRTDLAAELPDDSIREYVNETDLPSDGSMPSALQIVEEMPQFPGGLAALMRWLERNVSYPEYCRKKKIEGEVRVTFIVSDKGAIEEPNVSQKVHPFLDREALAAVRKMPRWAPGHIAGRAGRVRVTIPIAFQLE